MQPFCAGRWKRSGTDGEPVEDPPENVVANGSGELASLRARLAADAGVDVHIYFGGMR